VFDGWAGEMNFAPTTMVVTLRRQRPHHQVFDGGGRNEFRPYNDGGNAASSSATSSGV
jgi:hypothetical protein